MREVETVLNDIFGRNVRARREKLKMSVIELADAARMSQYTIYGVENGRNGTKLETAKLIAEALDCTVDDLIGTQQTSEAKKMALRVQDLEREVDELTQENRKLAQALAHCVKEDGDD